jgi:hypothetical protein
MGGLQNVDRNRPITEADARRSVVPLGSNPPPALLPRPTKSALARRARPLRRQSMPAYGPIPTPVGWVPTAMGAPTTVLVVVSITETVLLNWLAT